MEKQGGIATTQKKFLLSVADVAAHLGVCRQTVYNYIYREQLPSVKVRGMRRIRLESLEKWLVAHEQLLA